MTWQLQEAKNKLSQVLNTSIKSGPQIISRRGINTGVLMSYQDYQRLAHPPKDLKAVLLSGRGLAAGLDDSAFERDRTTPGRATEFSFDDELFA